MHVEARGKFDILSETAKFGAGSETIMNGYRVSGIRRALINRCQRAVLGIACAAALIVLSDVPANAQNTGPLMDRLERLERDIRTLNIQLSRGADAAGAKTPISAATSTTAPSSAGVARMTERLDNLEEDLRNATGGIEQIGHQIHQMSERLEKLVGDVDFRLNTLETKAGISGGGTATAPPPIAAAPVTGASAPTGIQASDLATQENPAATAAQAVSAKPGSLGTVSAKAVKEVQSASPVQPSPTASATAAAQPVAPPPAVPAPASLPAGTVKERYTYALNLLRQTNYDQAEIALQAFVKAHGDSALAGHAFYWLGETYYVRADYEQAAQVFFEGYQTKPKSAKAPDMLLKLGMALSHLKKPKEACATFGKLVQDFPQATTRINSAIQRERKRAGCR